MYFASSFRRARFNLANQVRFHEISEVLLGHKAHNGAEGNQSVNDVPCDSHWTTLSVFCCAACSVASAYFQLHANFQG